MTIDWRDPSEMHRRKSRLDEPWDAAQAVAPVAWAVNGVQRRGGYWCAWAVRVGWLESWGLQPTVYGYGATPEAAFRQLAARLAGGGCDDADKLWRQGPRADEIAEWYAVTYGNRATAKAARLLEEALA